MRILLIGNFAPDRQESMQRFGDLLARGLAERGHEVSTWAPEPRLVRLLPRYRYGGPAKFVGYVDKFILFPRRVRRRRALAKQADVVHILDHANAVYAPHFPGRPLLATVHDLLQIRAARGEFPQQRVSALGRRYQAWILRHIARLPHVAVPSQQVGQELVRLIGFPASRITPIPHGLNFPYQRLPLRSARAALARRLSEGGLPASALASDGPGFILNVGGGQWYKNRPGLLQIYAELRRRLEPSPRLVLVGKPLAPELATQVTRLGLQHDVVQLGRVSEQELQALYTLAEALLFPSWHEGFGWPVAEAQACGCPVITSDRAPMTEVGGDAALYIDPANPRLAAERIAALWPRRRELGERGLARSARWTTTDMMDRHVELYETLAARGQPAVAA